LPTPMEIDRFGDKNTKVKVILSTSGEFDKEFVVDVCKRLGKATLANFVYETAQ
jgi:formate-dependent phosphoribosylglycinamide formyltransferase (GAR transformylase)